MMLSDVCLSVAYIGPKSRTERSRKTKIGTVVVHFTRDSDTTFKVKKSRSPGRFGWLYWQGNMDIELGLVTDVSSSSGVHVFGHEFENKEDTLNISCSLNLLA